MSGEPNEPEVGSVAQEAARLLGALSDWAKDATHDVDEHLATGAAECAYCPLCRTVHAVRTLSPEVRDQLATAAGSALQAVSGLLGAVASGGGAGAAARPGVQHIDLDDDWPEEAPEHDADPEEGDR